MSSSERIVFNVLASWEGQFCLGEQCDRMEETRATTADETGLVLIYILIYTGTKGVKY